MSGQQIGTVVGGVVGAFFGMPQLGMAIGGFIGGVVDRTVIDGPKIGEVPSQTAQEGTPKPIIFARSQPIAGNVIFDAPPNIVTRNESQGKGGPKVKTESAYRTYAVGVCEGTEDGVVLLQAWKNGQLVFDVENPAMGANNQEFLKYVRWFGGTYTQMPSPDLEAKHGVGNVHAFRGTAYAVMVEEDVTDQRGAWSQWQWRVSTSATSYEPISEELVHTYLPPSTGGAGPYLSVDADGNPFALTATQDGLPAYDIDPGEYFVITSYDNELTPTGTEQVTNPGSAFGNPELQMVGITADGWGISKDTTHGYCKLIFNGATVADLRPESSQPGSWWFGENGYSPEYGGLVWFSDDSVYIGARKTSGAGTNWNSVFKWPLNAGGVISATAVIEDVSTDTSGPRFWMNRSRQGLIRTLNTDYELKRYDEDLAYLGDENVPAEVLAADDINGFGADDVFDLSVFIYDGDQISIYRKSTGDLLATYALENAGANICTRVVFGASAIYIQRRELFYFIPLLTTDGVLLLSDTVSRLCARVNLDADKIEVSDLSTTQVRGFTVTNTYPCYAALQALSQAFFFAPSNANGKIKFTKLGGDALATIYDDDLIDNGEEVEAETKRGDTISVPRVLHLNYYDVAGGLTTDKQRSERPEGSRSTGEQSIQTSVVLSADEAATIVAKNHAMIVEQQKGELTFSLPDNWLRLTESDPVFVQVDTKMVRAVIQKVDTDDGEQKYRAIRDRQSIHTMQVEGTPAAPVTLPPSNVVGPTRIEVIDAPLWRDQDDKLGFWVAVSGIYPAWSGATVEMSTDGGASYVASGSTNVSAVMGRTTSAMGDHPQSYPDTVNTLQVNVTTPYASLEGTDLTGMMNLKNLAIVGDELIQFADVDEVIEGTWDLSYFLRGRKGSATDAHGVGERFVMLNSAVFFVPASLVLKNKTLTFRAISFGLSVEDAVVTSIAFTGKNQIEREAAYLSAHRDGTDVIANWQGVGRLGGGMNSAQGLYYIGFRVTLTDGTVTQTFDQLDDSITKPLTAFTGPVTVRVQQRNSLTGLGPAIEVII